MTGLTGTVVSSLRYTPYGLPRDETGRLPTPYRYTGQRETGVGFYDYQARLYDPALGRFISADSIVPEPGQPQSLNRYMYVLGNPLRYTDPGGHIAQDENSEAQSIVAFLQQYGFNITIDWGLEAGFWDTGLWQLAELQIIQEAVGRLVQTFDGTPIKGSTVNVVRVNLSGGADSPENTIRIMNDFLASALPQVAFVHEFAHVWDYINSNQFSDGLPAFRGNEPGPTAYGSGRGLGTWSTHPLLDEWAESVAAYVYPEYIAYLRTPGSTDYENERAWQRKLNQRPEYRNSPQRRPGLGQFHKAYVALQIDGPFWPDVR